MSLGRIDRAAMTRTIAALLSFALLGATGATGGAARQAAPETVEAPPPSAEQLPTALRPQGAAILAEKDGGRRAKLVKSLAGEESGESGASSEFLVSLLDHDPSAAVRREIVIQLGHGADGAAERVLERHAASDPSADVSLLALDRLRERQVQSLRRTLEDRIELAKRSSDTDGARVLVAEDERWISLVHGTMLPSFLRRPPDELSVRPRGAAIRVVAFGDFGDGSESQRRTGAAIRREHAATPFDFGLTLGDNFYEEGAKSPEDPRWKSWWEDLYGGLGIRFYATLGNHDWKLPDSPAAEVLYSQKSASWTMPSPYYAFTAGEVEFFALDTNEVSGEQLRWLDEALRRSAARWKVVYGHHPIYSAGQHGDSRRLVESLLPVLRGRADVYLAGHDHDMQHLSPDGGVHFFVAGAGGAHQRPMHAHPRSLFAKTDQHGFAVLEADASRLSVRFVADDGSKIYEYTIRK